MNILSSERLAEYVRSDKYSNDLYKEHVNNHVQNNLTSMSIDALKNIFNEDLFSIYAAWKLTRFLGFSYCDHRKIYYHDKHEAKENVRAQTNTEEYLKHEKGTKRWVRLTNEEVERLENDKVHPLLPDVGHRVSETYVEFHIDCQPSFRSMEHTVSVWNPPGVRELIIYGQDMRQCSSRTLTPLFCVQHFMQDVRYTSRKFSTYEFLRAVRTTL